MGIRAVDGARLGGPVHPGRAAAATDSVMSQEAFLTGSFPHATPSHDMQGQTRNSGKTPAVSGRGLSRARNLFPVPQAGWGLLARDTG